MTAEQWATIGTNLALLVGGAWLGLERLADYRRKNGGRSIRAKSAMSLRSRAQQQRLLVRVHAVASDGSRPTAPRMYEIEIVEGGDDP